MSDSLAPAPRQPVRLADYRPYPFTLSDVELQFRLAPIGTQVAARLAFAPKAEGEDLRLDGEELRLVSLKLNGVALELTPDSTGLTIPAALLPAGAFVLETVVEIDPERNTALEGLYMSNGMYCTQCEAEGFRKITFYPDRPDVMARFTVEIESDLPVLLSNGNPAGAGRWVDPWPKPAYLFALVAGDLVAHHAPFTTASGRAVDLNIWVRPGDETRCDWAMTSLVRSMEWDERVYGREYDLDVFNIVAVDDFNMGAMENKGLNIFNSRYVLADAETATDDDFARIEAIIAHEYFHNWTGNRITCRDWFQLCLKEGLTVFRDQQFSGDMRSRAVKRIEDVLTLRARQFREDDGPLAHPVRPDHYLEINNFYTATIYEKGAELIGMLKTLVGDDAYNRSLTNYFDRYDGTAATIEDWLLVFEETIGRDLSQFALWYSQAGTPRLRMSEEYSEEYDEGTLTLNFSQATPTTPGQPFKQALHFPITVGLIGEDGREVMASRVLEMNQNQQSFRFEGLRGRPVASVLRGFSAPVVLEREMSTRDRAFLLAHDTDPFNRWEAGRVLAREVLCAMILQGADPMPEWLAAMASVVGDERLDPAFRALALRLPAEDDLARGLHDAGHIPDPSAIHRARNALAAALARQLEPQLRAIVAAEDLGLPFSTDAVSAGRRSLVAAAVSLLSQIDGGAVAATVYAGAAATGNMTLQVAALSALIAAGQGEAELAAFEARWADNRLVMDKWFTLQVLYAPPEAMAGVVERLTARPDFEIRNPNRFRAVIGALSANHAGFHHEGGAAYRLLADWLIQLDPLNPQTTARMSSAFDSWRRYDATRSEAMQAELRRMRAQPTLSRDLDEMTGRMLGEAV